MALSNTPRSMPREIRAIKNTDVAVISKGMPVKFDTATADGGLKCTAVTDKVIGIAMSDIPIGSYGDVMVRGVAPCLAGGTVAIGDRVGPDATGRVATTTTDKTSLIGVSNRAAAVTELFEVELGVGMTTSL